MTYHPSLLKNSTRERDIDRRADLLPVSPRREAEIEFESICMGYRAADHLVASCSIKGDLKGAAIARATLERFQIRLHAQLNQLVVPA